MIYVNHQPWIPSGKLTYHHIYGKSLFLMGKSTISMAMFNSFLYVYQRVYGRTHPNHPNHLPMVPVPVAKPRKEQPPLWQHHAAARRDSLH